MSSLLRFACNTDLGPKTLVACSINDNLQFMLAVLFFFRKIDENYARSDQL